MLVGVRALIFERSHTKIQTSNLEEAVDSRKICAVVLLLSILWRIVLSLKLTVKSGQLLLMKIEEYIFDAHTVILQQVRLHKQSEAP